MDKKEFAKRFQLNTLQPSLHRFNYPKELKEAAVLIALTEINHQLHVVLTTRAAHLKHHPGQVSFPGGKLENFDTSLTHAALRESEEEIGIDPRHVKVLGQLKPYHTISGYIVTPIVGLLETTPQYRIDENEVADVFHVPLTHLLDEKHHSQVETYHDGKFHNVYFISYKHYNIWGATAAMLTDLVNHLN